MLARDIKIINDKPYGFFDCSVSCHNDNIKHPILQMKFDTGKGVRTIAPLGAYALEISDIIQKKLKKLLKRVMNLKFYMGINLKEVKNYLKNL